MKHTTFDSRYLANFEVVEECRGDISLYPHSEQLPRLLGAILNEFFLPLPDEIRRVDERADGFHKLMLRAAASTFCRYINASRQDRLQLFPVLDLNLVAKIAIVQQMTGDTHLGKFHRFRFYAGDEFFPEVYASGKRLEFADHVLKRFAQRVPNNVGGYMSGFLHAFYSSPLVRVSVGKGNAFVVPLGDSVLAFTFKENEKELFITTCLSKNELKSMEMEVPTEAYILHYGTSFARPAIYNWSPNSTALKLLLLRDANAPPPQPDRPAKENEWLSLAASIKDRLVGLQHGPGSHICFLDDIPGTACLEFAPGQFEKHLESIKATQAPESKKSSSEPSITIKFTSS